MSNGGYRKPFLIDSGAIPFLWDEQLEKKLWRHFGDTKQYVCAIVCYEMYQKKPAYHSGGDLEQFVKLLEDDKLEFLPRKREDAKAAADLAVAVMIELKKRIKDKAKRKARFRELYHDILIAGLALNRSITVFTDDPKDWQYLEGIVYSNRKKFGSRLGFHTKKLAMSR